jgi:polysaccharide deacetylase family protein (PEP-CTERM system associated)
MTNQTMSVIMPAEARRAPRLRGLRRWLRAVREVPGRVLHPLRRARAVARLRRRGLPRRILVLCHGNICRSPYAAAALSRAFAGRGVRVRIVSAGFLEGGRGCPAAALGAAAARGVDLARHRSRPITARAARRPGLVVVMDARQRRALWERFGRPPGDVLLLGDLDPGPIRTRTIADPIQGSDEVFEQCYARIDRCVETLVATLDGPAGGGAPAKRPGHHFTVDLEEYFQVSAFEQRIRRSAWYGMESRVERTTWRLLEMLESHGARATFFVLGWVGLRHPELVRALAAAGHEVASHGWDHQRVTGQSPTEFRISVRRTRLLLEELTGAPVVGFRAPSFSIVPGHEWALDVLIEEGYRYDSSLYPFGRPGYGYAGTEPAPHWIRRPVGRILEVPPATLRRCGLTLPAGGGAYFRLFPYALVARALTAFERRGESGTFYIHPWELDAEQPRVRVPWPTRVRHYGGLGRVPGRLERLLGQFQFTPIADTVERYDFMEDDPARSSDRRREGGEARVAAGGMGRVRAPRREEHVLPPGWVARHHDGSART